MEKDPELSNGNYTTHFRALDTRIGRWWSIDPKANIQQDQTPYSLSNNTPIFGSDPNGDLCLPCIIFGIGALMTAATPTHSSSGNHEADAAGIANAQANQNFIFGAVLATPFAAAAYSAASVYYAAVGPTVVVTATRIIKSNRAGTAVMNTAKAYPKTTKFASSTALTFGLQGVGSGIANWQRTSAGLETEWAKDMDIADGIMGGLVDLVPMPFYARAGLETVGGVLVDLDFNLNFTSMFGKDPETIAIELAAGGTGVAMKKFNFDGIDVDGAVTGASKSVEKTAKKINLLGDFSIKGLEIPFKGIFRHQRETGNFKFGTPYENKNEEESK
jgi:hypothetical protein